MWVNDAETMLCDLGSASDAGENEITPHLVSRSYRALGSNRPVYEGLSIETDQLPSSAVRTTIVPGRSNNQLLLHF
ncbi:hypothetical protein B0H16DRAFT_399248 [Mycena metata]|uniref:Uncharacterized protein n=1 Tax=Mycena metata TaxID=1033252 RepID=A0AAD7NLD4_9AGAR|nr:hypothetical protein B0H16DRAFT_399248 [Mycena metata]